MDCLPLPRGNLPGRLESARAARPRPPSPDPVAGPPPTSRRRLGPNAPRSRPEQRRQAGGGSGCGGAAGRPYIKAARSTAPAAAHIPPVPAPPPAPRAAAMVVPGPGLQPSPEPLAGRRLGCGPGRRGSGEGRRPRASRGEARASRSAADPRLRRKKTTLRQHGRAAVHAGRKAGGKARRRRADAQGPWSLTASEGPAARARKSSAQRRLWTGEKAEAPGGTSVDGRSP